MDKNGNIIIKPSFVIYPAHKIWRPSIHQDPEVLSADSVFTFSKKLGWTVYEEPGIAIVNNRYLNPLSGWESGVWNSQTLLKGQTLDSKLVIGEVYVYKENSQMEKDLAIHLTDGRLITFKGLRMVQTPTEREVFLYHIYGSYALSEDPGG